MTAPEHRGCGVASYHSDAYYMYIINHHTFRGRVGVGSKPRRFVHPASLDDHYGAIYQRIGNITSWS